MSSAIRDVSVPPASGNKLQQELAEGGREGGLLWQQVRHRKKREGIVSASETTGSDPAGKQSVIPGLPPGVHGRMRKKCPQESPASQSRKQNENGSCPRRAAASDALHSLWTRLPESAGGSGTTCSSSAAVSRSRKDNRSQASSVLLSSSSRLGSSTMLCGGASDAPPGARGAFALCDFLVNTGAKKKGRRGSVVEDASRAPSLVSEDGTKASSFCAHGAWKVPETSGVSARPAVVADGETFPKDLASVMKEEEALHEAKQRKLRLLLDREQARDPSSVVRSPGLPSIVVVPRHSAARKACTSSGGGRATVRRMEARVGSAGKLSANCGNQTASFNCWGKEAALRVQGEDSLVTDLNIIQMQQLREQEEEQVRLREEAEIQEALRLIEEMEKRECEAARQMKRDIDRAAVGHMSQAKGQTHGRRRTGRRTRRAYEDRQEDSKRVQF